MIFQFRQFDKVMRDLLATGITVDNWDWHAPISLAADEPIPETVFGRWGTLVFRF
jgi:hypothetical protein